MGKISQYQTRQLASSAVGVPSPDKSGEIIAAGLQEGIKGVVSLAADLKDKRTDAAALNAVRDAEVSYERARLGAKENAMNDPDRFLALMKNVNAGVQETALKGLDSTTAAKAGTLLTAKIGQEDVNNVKWASERKTAIHVDNLFAARYKAAITASTMTDPAQYRAYVTQAMMESSVAEQGALMEGQILKNNEDFKKTAFEMLSANALGDNPAAFFEHANNGAFTGLAPDELIGSMATKANNAIPEWRKRNQLKNTLAASDDVQSFASVIAETGMPPMQDILAAKQYVNSRKVMAASDKTGKTYIPENYEKALDALIENQSMKIVSGKPEEGVSGAWASKIRAFMKSSIADPVSGVKAEGAMQQLDAMIGLYAGLVDDLGKGRIDLTQFQTLHGLLNTKSTERRGGPPEMKKVIDRVRATGWWGPKTPFDHAVELVDKDLDKRKVKGDQIFVDYLTEYRQVFASLSEPMQTKISTATAAEKRRMVKLLLTGERSEIEREFGTKGLLSVRTRVEKITNPYKKDEEVFIGQAVQLPDGSMAVVHGVDDNGYAIIDRSGKSFLKSLNNQPR